ncbi:Putative F0F1-ATPase subunit Ca2+/Mg2+ transporter [Parelusimicrobium proximum]|uniref:AtpZ/AtpI family protein n=1 Tax=Parelusimicrobium proximum TaxID=3228953 RepID=UPI003D184CAB
MNKKDFLVSSYLGIQFALSIVLFGFAGYKLDEWLKTKPLFLMVLGFAGFGVGMYAIIKTATAVTKKDKKK